MTEKVHIDIDRNGNGQFGTGSATEAFTKYKFEFMADSASKSDWYSNDKLQNVTGRKWTGHIHDGPGGASVQFEGLDQLTIEHVGGEPIEWVVNGQSMGEKKQISLTPPGSASGGSFSLDDLSQVQMGIGVVALLALAYVSRE
mgnify:CR=1 FL=1